MALTDKYDFELLRNEAENLVFDELEKQLEAHEGDICRCNECVMDMAAMALNGMKPLYRVSLLGTLYAAQALSDETYAENLRHVVSSAIEKIRENPAHD
jgi:competence protein ComFB